MYRPFNSNTVAVVIMILVMPIVWIVKLYIWAGKMIVKGIGWVAKKLIEGIV